MTSLVFILLFKEGKLIQSTQHQLKEFQRSNADCGIQGVCQVIIIMIMFISLTANVNITNISSPEPKSHW